VEYLRFAYFSEEITMANDFCEQRLLEPAPEVLPAVRTTTSGDLRQFRIGKRESQEKFWGRFGVTQSSGSRFETGLSIPAPVALLLKLYLNGKLSDGDLLE
jgi:DNA-binding transcriptional regulator YiaG